MSGTSSVDGASIGRRVRWSNSQVTLVYRPEAGPGAEEPTLSDRAEVTTQSVEAGPVP
jgi:hypothetical protein